MSARISQRVANWVIWSKVRPPWVSIWDTQNWSSMACLTVHFLFFATSKLSGVTSFGLLPLIQADSQKMAFSQLPMVTVVAAAKSSRSLAVQGVPRSFHGLGSSLQSSQSQRRRRAEANFLRLRIPSPPRSFGLHTFSQFTRVLCIEIVLCPLYLFWYLWSHIFSFVYLIKSACSCKTRMPKTQGYCVVWNCELLALDNLVHSFLPSSGDHLIRGENRTDRLRHGVGRWLDLWWRPYLLCGEPHQQHQIHQLQVPPLRFSLPKFGILSTLVNRGMSVFLQIIFSIFLT